MARTQGSKWIRRDKRLAIYLRDGMGCMFCGRGLEDGDVTLTLDHIVPVELGGSNGEDNLITACRVCNSSKGTRSLEEFAEAVVSYRDFDFDPQDLVTHIRSHLSLDLRPYRKEAKAIIARRNTWLGAVAEANNG